MGQPYAPGIPSIAVSGTAAAPGAGSSFVVATAPANGWYEITGTVVISGAAEPQALNVKLVANGGTVVQLPVGGGVGAVVPFRIPQILLAGAQNVTLTAVAAATVSTVYSGNLVLTEVAD
jgi:hypothetical protein